MRGSPLIGALLQDAKLESACDKSFTQNDRWLSPEFGGHRDNHCVLSSRAGFRDNDGRALLPAHDSGCLRPIWTWGLGLYVYDFYTCSRLLFLPSRWQVHDFRSAGLGKSVRFPYHFRHWKRAIGPCKAASGRSKPAEERSGAALQIQQ